MNKIEIISKKIIVSLISLLSILILLYLTVTSMNATVYLSEYEKCFYCKDNALVHICVILFVTAFFLFTRRYAQKLCENKHVVWLIVTLILAMYGIILLFLYRHLRLLPVFDQNSVFQIAGRITNYDYIDFLKGGYGEKWTNQWGYLLLLVSEFRLFGVRNPDAVYLINIIFMTGTAWGLYGFGKRFLKNPSVTVLTAVCLFIPFWSFSTFIYGNVPSWFFSIFAVNLLYDFFGNGSSVKGVISSLLIVAAVMLKTTQLIFFVAFIIYLLVQAFPVNRGAIKRLSILALCILMYFISGRCIHQYMEKATGMTLGEGVPRIAHIAMGMHETSDSSGWYDGYIDTVYEDNGYDISLTSQAAITDLKNSLQQFKSNPIGAIGFFSRKIQSQWIEPTCESIFILLNRHSYSDTGQYNPNGLPVNRLGSILIQLMNLMQTVIYFGAFLFYSGIGLTLIKSRQAGKIKPEYRDITDSLFTGLVIIGAFVFYIFWEANSQYALFFMLLLIPCAVTGYGKTADKIIYIFRDSSGQEAKSLLIPAALVISLIVIAALVPEGSAVGHLLAPSWSTEQYKIYRSEMLAEGIKEYNPIDTDHTLYATRYDDTGKARFHAGRYYIIPADDPDSYLVPSDEAAGTSVITGNAGDNRVILTSREQGYALRFQSTQLVMDIENASKSPGARVQQYEQNGDPSQVYGFTPTDDGTFFITYPYAGDLVLTAHKNGNVTVEHKEDENSSQHWKVIAE